MFNAIATAATGSVSREWFEALADNEQQAEADQQRAALNEAMRGE